MILVLEENEELAELRADTSLTKQAMSQAGKMQNDMMKMADVNCLLYTSPSPRDRTRSRMPSSA